jgi:hypothetical protein
LQRTQGKKGDNNRALALSEEVFVRTPFYVGLNLSSLDCSLGRCSQALAVLNRMLEFDPDSIEVRRRFSEVNPCGVKKAESAAIAGRITIVVSTKAVKANTPAAWRPQALIEKICWMA